MATSKFLTCWTRNQKLEQDFFLIFFLTLKYSENPKPLFLISYQEDSIIHFLECTYYDGISSIIKKKTFNVNIKYCSIIDWRSEMRIIIPVYMFGAHLLWQAVLLLLYDGLLKVIKQKWMYYYCLMVNLRFVFFPWKPEDLLIFLRGSCED